MGTNYYLHRDVCPHCKRSDSPLHIGKSSAGWCFALHVDEEAGINSLADWQALWASPGSKIMNEYGDNISPPEMLATITERIHPRGLSRHIKDGRHCVGNGDGTYDLIRGEFS